MDDLTHMSERKKHSESTIKFIHADIFKSKITRDNGSVSILLPENVHKRFRISPRGSLIIKVRLATYHKLIAVSGSLFFELIELSFLQEIGSTHFPPTWRINGSGNYAILEKVAQTSVLGHMEKGKSIHRHGDNNGFEHD